MFVCAHSSYHSYMVWYVCVYKSFRSRKVQHRASHRFRCVVVWDSWLRKLFYSRQLYTTIFVWRLWVCSALYHARVSSSIHIWSTRTSPTSFTVYRYMDSRCAANIYRQMFHFMTRAAACWISKRRWPQDAVESLECLSCSCSRFLECFSKIPFSSYNHLVLINLCRSLALSSYFASCVSSVGIIFRGYFPESLYLNSGMDHKRSTDKQSPIHRSP